MSWSVEMAAKMYRIPLVDYGADRRGVLIGSGAGIMMAVMDAAPLRWCVDADEIQRQPSYVYRLAEFVLLANAAEGVALAGWFSISDPEPLRCAFASLSPPGVVYAGNVRLGVPGEVETLERLISSCRERFSSADKPLAATG